MYYEIVQEIQYDIRLNKANIIHYLINPTEGVVHITSLKYITIYSSTWKKFVGGVGEKLFLFVVALFLSERSISVFCETQ